MRVLIKAAIGILVVVLICSCGGDSLKQQVVGKWKLTSDSPDFKEITDLGVILIFEFTDDGRLLLGAEGEVDGQDILRYNRRLSLTTQISVGVVYTFEVESGGSEGGRTSPDRPFYRKKK